MAAVSHRKMVIQIMIAFALLVGWFVSDSMAGCTIKIVTTCAGSSDPKGAYCDNAFCHCGYRFNETSTSYTVRCANPGWGCWQPPAWYCDCPVSIYTDQTYIQVDSVTDQPCKCAANETRACELSDGCPGNQTCNGGTWGACTPKGTCCPVN